MSAYNGKVNWIYRHFPLSFHPNAQKAAEASECAFEQGGNDKFWEYADVLFTKGADNTQLATYAADLGLDVDAFQKCLDSGKYAQKIADEESGGQTAGVNGTPGNIIINNKTGEKRLVSGAQAYESFQKIIDEYLKS